MRPLDFIAPVSFAIFLWWFSTGAIIVAYGRSRRFTQAYFALTTVAGLAALGGVYATRTLVQLSDVYVAVTCGVLIYGWQTASYYLGFVTGRPPRGTPHSFSERLFAALRSIAHHELTVVAVGLLLAAITWQGNRWALWMYLALWVMHSSAQLCVFLGVRNFRIEFLPEHLQYLRQIVLPASQNGYLPGAMAVATAVGLAMMYRGIAPGGTIGEQSGLLMVGTMVLLGVLEHALLVLPLPATLWGWGVRELPDLEPPTDQIAANEPVRTPAGD